MTMNVFINTRWSSLPSMPERRCAASALHINCNRDAIVVIGGLTDLIADQEKGSQSAFLLVNTPNSGGEPWRWRALSPMTEGRCWPGVLQLDSPGSDDRIQRVLVAGGQQNNAEILEVDCIDVSDGGQWTQIEPLSRKLGLTILVALGDRSGFW